MIIIYSITSAIIENAETQIGCNTFEVNDDLTSIKIAGEDVSTFILQVQLLKKS